MDENKTKQHRRYIERRSDNFCRSQDESQSDEKIIVWSHMFICPRRLKVNKGEKYNHSYIRRENGGNVILFWNIDFGACDMG